MDVAIDYRQDLPQYYTTLFFFFHLLVSLNSFRG